MPRPFHLAKTSTESRQASEERLPKLAVDRFFLISRKRHSGVVAENGFEVPSYDANSLGYLLLVSESDLPRAGSRPTARLTSLKNSRLSIERRDGIAPAAHSGGVDDRRMSAAGRALFRT